MGLKKEVLIGIAIILILDSNSNNQIKDTVNEKKDLDNEIIDTISEKKDTNIQDPLDEIKDTNIQDLLSEIKQDLDNKTTIPTSDICKKQKNYQNQINSIINSTVNNAVKNFLSNEQQNKYKDLGEPKTLDLNKVIYDKKITMFSGIKGNCPGDIMKCDVQDLEDGDLGNIKIELSQISNVGSINDITFTSSTLNDNDLSISFPFNLNLNTINITVNINQTLIFLKNVLPKDFNLKLLIENLKIPITYIIMVQVKLHL